MLRPFPLPVRITVCGEPVAESVNTKAEALFPLLVGLKVTLTVQDNPFASVPVQVLAPFTNCVESPVETSTDVKVTVEPLLFR